MTESTELFKRWTRPLIGGVLSALLAGLAVSTIETDDILLFYGFFVLLFLFPVININSTVLALTIILWFVVGCVIMFRVKKNGLAIFYWFIAYIVAFVLTIMALFLRGVA